nr:hypothetical protein [Nitratireductor luteus]
MQNELSLAQSDLQRHGKRSPHPADPAFAARLREQVVAVEEFDCSFSAEHAIGRKNQIFYDRYTLGTATF